MDNVPINGYYINDKSGRILNTTDLSYILSPPDPINPEVCDMTTVTVSAVNGAGIGQPANTSFYYERGILMFIFNKALKAINIIVIKGCTNTDKATPIIFMIQVRLMQVGVGLSIFIHSY